MAPHHDEIPLSAVVAQLGLQLLHEERDALAAQILQLDRRLVDELATLSTLALLVHTAFPAWPPASCPAPGIVGHASFPAIAALPAVPHHALNARDGSVDDVHN